MKITSKNPEAVQAAMRKVSGWVLTAGAVAWFSARGSFFSQIFQVLNYLKELIQPQKSPQKSPQKLITLLVWN
jgi:hypothetical protein